MTNTPDRFTRRSQILVQAEHALNHRIARRRAVLTLFGSAAVATALIFAWFISPFNHTIPSPDQHTPPHPQPVATNNLPSPTIPPNSSPQWLTTTAATGQWIVDFPPPRGWLITNSPDPDWLTTDPSPLAIASDDDIEQLVAQSTQPEDRGIIRINGKLLLSKNLSPNPASTQPFNN